MSKHTPAPWVLDTGRIVGSNGDPVGEAVKGRDIPSEYERVTADRVMQAAAPEMLAALKSIATIGIHEIHDLRAVVGRMQAAALDAIAKAEGRS